MVTNDCNISWQNNTLIEALKFQQISVWLHTEKKSVNRWRKNSEKRSDLWSPVCNTFGSIFNSFLIVGIQVLNIFEIGFSLNEKKSFITAGDSPLTHLHYFLGEMFKIFFGV